MSESPVQLGPFSVSDRIGEGGMAVVYRGEHRKTGVPVAIKVIRRDAGDAVRRRFHEEVQAHAGLQHPGVVYLFEYGEVDRHAAEEAEGELRAGDPYVAMELADRGTVRDAMPFSGWETVRRMLVQILDTLAYSHARGVVHRDLKPANFLVFDDDEEGVGRRVKLADFGIAHAFEGESQRDTSELESASGTPYYMAPEQTRGRWRQYGPWTDLYALGCIAWELVCGHPPYTGDSALEILMQHEDEELPPLDPQFPIPDELASWIHRAMAADPGRRFRRAADAAWVLPRGVLADRAAEVEPEDAKPGDSPTAEVETVLEEPRVTQVESLAPTLQLNERAELAHADTVRGDQPADDEATRSETDRDDKDASPADAERLLAEFHPPLPEDWRPAETESLPAPLVGAGLGLFGLREPPFVDRREECDHIWARLQEVVEFETTRTTYIYGEAGTGKSRLVEWMATRAHEVGAVQVLKAVHTAGGGPNEGLRSALEQHLRCVKMDRGEVHEHLLEALPPLPGRDDHSHELDARAVTEFLRPTDDDPKQVEGPAYRFSSPTQKYALVTRTLERLGADRPVLLWLDDLQWGAESLGWLEHLHELDREPPEVLSLATVRADLVREHPDLRERLEALESAELSMHLDVDPLSRVHQRELLEALLPLEDELADQLAERTEGRPLFAMQLLGHWIDEEAIEVGPEGFRVPENRQPDLPDDIHALWQRRFDRFLEDLDGEEPRATRAAIERAAVLGREVDGEEWRAVCEQLGIARPARIGDELVERGLAERTDQGWAFAHGMIVDTLAEQARCEGRWADHHRRCGELLERLYPDKPFQTAARRSDHWEAAGDLEAAIDALWEEYEGRRRTGDMGTVPKVLDRRATLMEKVDVPDDDPRAIENDLTSILFRVHEGTKHEGVAERLADVRARAERAGADRLVAKALEHAADFRVVVGDFDAAVDCARSAAERAQAVGDLELFVQAMRDWGWAEYYAGHLGEAKERFAEARRSALSDGNHFRALRARRDLGAMMLARGEVEGARRMLEEVLEASREAGFRGVEMLTVNQLGELARFSGNVERGRKLYRRYETLARELGDSFDVANARLNQGLVELMAGEFDEAVEQLKNAEYKFEDLGRKDAHPALFQLGWIALAAGLDDWQQFDDRIDRYADGWPEDSGIVKDHPWLLEMAGDYADEAGERWRAEQAWELARDLWEELEDEEAVARVGQKLAVDK